MSFERTLQVELAGQSGLTLLTDPASCDTGLLSMFEILSLYCKRTSFLHAALLFFSVVVMKCSSWVISIKVDITALLTSTCVNAYAGFFRMSIATMDPVLELKNVLNDVKVYC